VRREICNGSQEGAGYLRAFTERERPEVKLEQTQVVPSRVAGPAAGKSVRMAASRPDLTA